MATTFTNRDFAFINIGDDQVVRGQSRTFDGAVPENFNALREYFVVEETAKPPKEEKKP